MTQVILLTFAASGGLIVTQEIAAFIVHHKFGKIKLVKSPKANKYIELGILFALAVIGLVLLFMSIIAILLAYAILIGAM